MRKLRCGSSLSRGITRPQLPVLWVFLSHDIFCPESDHLSKRTASNLGAACHAKLYSSSHGASLLPESSGCFRSVRLGPLGLRTFLLSRRRRSALHAGICAKPGGAPMPLHCRCVPKFLQSSTKWAQDYWVSHNYSIYLRMTVAWLWTGWRTREHATALPGACSHLGTCASSWLIQSGGSFWGKLEPYENCRLSTTLQGCCKYGVTSTPGSPNDPALELVLERGAPGQFLQLLGFRVQGRVL